MGLAGGLADNGQNGSGGGGGGGSLTVTDGVTPVANATTLEFLADATVSSPGGGVAGVTISGTGGNPGFPTGTTDHVLYVSKSGNDSTGDGLSPASAYLTITKALSTLGSQTANILIGSGVFQEEVWIGGPGSTAPVNLIGTGAPGADSTFSGTVIQCPSDFTNAINVVGVVGASIRDITTRSHSLSSVGVGLRILGSNNTKAWNWYHDNQGFGNPTKSFGGIGLAISHSEKCQINGYAVTWSSQGMIIGVEADENHLITAQFTANYQDVYAGPWEGYRSRLTSGINSSVTTWPIAQSAELQPPNTTALAYTMDFIAAPSAPACAASGSGSTLAVGTYTVAVTYTTINGETAASATTTQAVTSGQNLVITSPSSAAGVGGWYAYVQAPGVSAPYRQNNGTPTNIGTNITITAPPLTPSGFTAPVNGDAFVSEGIAYTGNTSNQLTGVIRAVVGKLNSAIDNVTTALHLTPLSPGNAVQNTHANPQMATIIPSSGTLLIDSEQITYTGKTAVGDGTFNLTGVTRGANATSAASHVQYSACQDIALASAVSHSANVFVVNAHGLSNTAGAWGGGDTFDMYKSTVPQAQKGGDQVEEWWSGGHITINWDSAEVTTNQIHFYASAISGNIHIRRSIAGASAITDDTLGSIWESPTGAGSLTLSSTASYVIVERPGALGTFTDQGTNNSGSALRVTPASATKLLLDATTVQVDGNVLTYDAASGLIKGTTPSGGSITNPFTVGTAGHEIKIGAGSWFGDVGYVYAGDSGDSMALDVVARAGGDSWIDIVDGTTDIVNAASAANYESLKLYKHNGSYIQIGSGFAGSGAARPIILQKDGGVVGLGLGITSVAASAYFEINSNGAGNNLGFLGPRSTTTQRTGISSPATGLTVYDTTVNDEYVYTGSTNGWQRKSGARDRERALQSALGFNGQTFDIYNASGVTQSGMNTQQLQAGLVGMLVGDIVTNIILNVSTAGVGTTPTGFFVALYDKTGVLLASSSNQNANAALTATGFAVLPLSAPFTITKDDGYYLAALSNGLFATTPAQYVKEGNSNASIFPKQCSGGAFKYTQQTGQSTLPGPATLASSTVGQWFGWS